MLYTKRKAAEDDHPASASETDGAALASRQLTRFTSHPPYFHDGSAATLLDVVNHYDDHFGLNLTEAQKADLVEYLKSL